MSLPRSRDWILDINDSNLNAPLIRENEKARYDQGPGEFTELSDAKENILEAGTNLAVSQNQLEAAEIIDILNDDSKVDIDQEFKSTEIFQNFENAFAHKRNCSSKDRLLLHILVPLLIPPFGVMNMLGAFSLIWGLNHDDSDSNNLISLGCGIVSSSVLAGAYLSYSIYRSSYDPYYKDAVERNSEFKDYLDAETIEREAEEIGVTINRGCLNGYGIESGDRVSDVKKKFKKAIENQEFIYSDALTRVGLHRQRGEHKIILEYSLKINRHNLR